MTKLTNQKAFNKTAKHLLTQRKKSESEEGGCLYRGPDSTKCAIGCLIPNKLMSMKLNDLNIVELKAKGGPEIKQLFEQCDPVFLVGLQGIHDSFTVGSWAKQLKKLGQEYGLDISVIKKTLDSLKEGQS